MSSTIFFLSFEWILFLLFNSIFPNAKASNQQIITVQIYENISTGTKITDLRTKLFPLHDVFVRFTLTSNPYFIIKDNSVLYTKGSIDRDEDRKLCQHPDFPAICQWSGFLFSDLGKHYDLIVIIDDVNDNPPRWEIDNIQLKIPENTADGHKLQFPLAVDLDYGANGVQFYKVLPPSSPFSISSLPNRMKHPFLMLKNDQKLDRELNSMYHLTLIAYDGGTQKLSGTVQVTVQVLDENDNDPLFESSRYQISIDEDVQPGSIIPLRIRAFDLDSGEFGKLSFHFAVSTPSHIFEKFTIDPTNGQLRTQKLLNSKDRRQFYDFTIVAKDGGIPPRTGQTNVRIEIIDKNVHSPEIKVNPMPDPTIKSIQILESSYPNQIIASLTVEDRDLGLNGKFNCSTSGPNANDLRLTYSKRLGNLEIYFLETKRSFDRENESLLSIRISCTDYGSPPQIGSKDLVIEIIDINDHSPTFEKSEYLIRTTEGNDRNSLIFQLNAHDMDAGENARLRYHVRCLKQIPTDCPFDIDGDGKITSKSELDRETFPDGFQLLIVAFDNGQPPRNGSTLMKVDLEDINDCAPEFSEKYYKFKVKEDYENIFRRQLVGRVFATDRDLRENAAVYYRLSPEASLSFEIDSKSGSIFSSRLIDRESINFPLTFLCMAVDNPNNLLFRKTSTVEVTVEIEDVNDHKPVFVYPNETNQDVRLSYHAKKGYVITTVFATDNDIRENAQLKYIITKGNPLQLFDLDETSGTLKLTKNLDQSHKGVEILTIKAVDSGKANVHMAVSQIRLIIDDFKLETGNQEDMSSSTSGSEQNLPKIFNPSWWEPNKLIIISILFITAVISCILIGAICVMAKRRNSEIEKNSVKMINVDRNSICKSRLSQGSIFEEKVLALKNDGNRENEKFLRIDMSEKAFYLDNQSTMPYSSPTYLLT